MGSHNVIYSVGYEGLEVSGLIARLSEAGVTLVVDARLNPSSRRPGWSKKSLGTTLRAAGIEYRHDRVLGNPPENRDSFRRGDREEGRRRMREIFNEGAMSTLEWLAGEAVKRDVAVLCVEREPERCHRQVIIEMVQELDARIDVVHIV